MNGRDKLSPGSNAKTHDAYGMVQNVSASNYKELPKAEVRKQLQAEGEEQQKPPAEG